MMKQNKEIPKGYKDSSLGIIPKEWKVKRLGEIAKITSGGTPLRDKKEYWNGNIPWITTSLLNNSKVTAAEEYITQKGLENSATKLLPSGTILMAMYGQGKTRGKVSKLMIDAATNQACAAFNISGQHFDYVYYQLDSKYDDIRNLSNDGGQKNLSLELIKEIKLTLPPLPEQQKIAEILSTWDKAIEKQTALIEKLELRKRGLMQQLFTGKKRLKDFNEEWKTIKFGDVMEKMSNGLSYDTTLISGIPVTRIETISKGMIDYKKIGYAEEIENIENYRLRVGDILFSHINSLAHIGKVAIYRGEYPLFHGMNLLLMRANTLIQNEFLYYFLCSESSKKKMKSLAKQAVNQASINTKELKYWVIRLPSLCEQVDITNILMTSDKEIDLARTKLTTLRSQKNGLMQQLLTGKKRINHINS